MLEDELDRTSHRLVAVLRRLALADAISRIQPGPETSFFELVLRRGVGWRQLEQAEPALCRALEV